jgi:hypothetical protein
MTRFKPRQRVWIINCTLGGRFLVKGRARIVRALGKNRYLVRFPDGELVGRSFAVRDTLRVGYSAASQGLRSQTPVGSKSARLRVTTVMP